MSQSVLSRPRSALPALAFAGLVLAACGPLSMYYKAGTPVSEVNRTMINCEVEALEKVPMDRRIERDPVRIVPRRVCDSAGNCSVFYDRVGGGVRTWDANADLRARVTNQCMIDKGYSNVDLPACPQAIRNAATAGATTVLPRLAPNSCVIRNNDGTFQIVTPG